MKTYSAVFIQAGSIRNLTFEAIDNDEALRMALALGIGLKGEATEIESANQSKMVQWEPEAFDGPNTCRKLGGICRTSLYRLVKRNKLDRLPHTRKLLITRASIERYCGRGK